MRSRRAFLSALAAFSGVAALSGSALGQNAEVPVPVPRPKKTPDPNAALPAPQAASTGGGAAPTTVQMTGGRVIVMRGLYNIFSRGMDKISADLKARGVENTLINHSRWQVLSEGIIADYSADPKKVVPLILIGHSLGGDASIVMSNWLAHNRIPVRLVVVFDAVAQLHPVIGGVEEVINFYKPKGYGQEVKAAPSFNGVLNNIDLTERKDIDHLNIDKDPVLQAEVIDKVVAILSGAQKKPAAATAAKS